MRRFILLILALFSVGVPGIAAAHCQIPCGIFDDSRQFKIIEEHIVTIEKSMREINTLAAEERPDIHMISRWTANKEEHAIKIQDIASAYFLAQRVKVPPQDAGELKTQMYVKHVTLLHQIIVGAMKARQSTDLDVAAALREKVEAYEAHYFEEHGHKHED